MMRVAAPVVGESLAEAAERIRAAAPILGAHATNEDCRIRRQLVSDTLAARGVAAGSRIWHTAQLADGHVAGIWATSIQEAELELSIWRDERCHWVVPDPDSRLFHEYFPRGKRSAREADRRFPLGRPRRIRDQFAAATSLLDGLPNVDGPSRVARGR